MSDRNWSQKQKVMAEALGMTLFSLGWNGPAIEKAKDDFIRIISAKEYLEYPVKEILTSFTVVAETNKELANVMAFVYGISGG